MPELPEVETTLRGIRPFVKGKQITEVIVRNASLRWPIPVKRLQALVGVKVESVERRGKYLLFHTKNGTLLLHLGMSGSLRVLEQGAVAGKHDHLDITLNKQKILRLNDPRRFGCCLLLEQPYDQHKLLAGLGPEPLSAAFDGDYLFKRSRKRTMPVKNFIMDGKTVVGVGNIYASESLFEAGVRPTARAGKISMAKYQILAGAIKNVLEKAIKAGGTTLNDFTQADGNPGYFEQQLKVYGRKDQPCLQCGAGIQSKVIGQRNTYYCYRCQSYP